MAFILALALLFQTTFFYDFFSALGSFRGLGFLKGHTLDLVLLLLVYLSLHRTLWTALIWASLISLCCDGMGHAWRGGQTLSYLSIAMLLSFGRQYMMLRTFVARAFFFIAITAIDAVLQFYWGSFFERGLFFWGGMTMDVMVQAAINMSVATLFVTTLLEFDYWAKGYRFSEVNVVFSDGRRHGIKTF